MSSLRNSYAKLTNQPKRPKIITASLNGLGVTTNAIGNYSIVNERFYFECPADDEYTILHFDMLVTATAVLTATNYDGIVGGLPNGIDWFVIRDGVETILTEAPLKTNDDLFRIGHHYQAIDYALAVSTHSYAGHLFDFSDGIILAPGDQMGVILRDDLTALTRHEFLLHANHFDGISRP